MPGWGLNAGSCGAVAVASSSAVCSGRRLGRTRLREYAAHVRRKGPRSLRGSGEGLYSLALSCASSSGPLLPRRRAPCTHQRGLLGVDALRGNAQHSVPGILDRFVQACTQWGKNAALRKRPCRDTLQVLPARLPRVPHRSGSLWYTRCTGSKILLLHYFDGPTTPACPTPPAAGLDGSTTSTTSGLAPYLALASSAALASHRSASWLALAGFPTPPPVGAGAHTTGMAAGGRLALARDRALSSPEMRPFRPAGPGAVSGAGV